MLECVIDKLIGLLGQIAALSKEKRELKDGALRRISIALQETKLYYRDIGRGKERNMESEAQLAKYWAAAAIPLRHIDEELAVICEYKGEFWADPDHWFGDQIKKVGIKLDNVSQAYRKLAMPKAFSSRRLASTWQSGLADSPPASLSACR